MKREIGCSLPVCPTLLTLVGVAVGCEAKWTLACHVGIVDYDRLLVGLCKRLGFTKHMDRSGRFSLNLVSEALLPQVQRLRKRYRSGCGEGAAPAPLAWTASAEGVPLLEGSPLSVVCRVVDFYDTEVFDNLICKMEHSYAEASVLTRSGSVDYAALHPVLLEKSQDLYLRTSALSGTRRARRSRDS